ncbi:MAG: hypothetical protein QHH26_02715 [Armatimonadota bacterium]|nr:hypothetical protein [Armatimonadota bacterium]
MRNFRQIVILLAMTMLMCVILAEAGASVVSEGMVITVQEWTLYIRTPDNKPLSFNPYYVFNGTNWVPSGPAKTVFPCLESGERVRVTWTMDVEGKRRVDAIQIISALEGTTSGVVVSSSRNQLVIRPKDEPGTVTMNPRFVLIEGKWVPDPVIVNKLVTLTPKTKVTVRWFWDKEGRKRIAALDIGWPPER